MEGKQHIACRTLTMLSYNNLCFTSQVIALFVLIKVIILGTMNKEHHIGILLDGSGLTKVTQLRTFALCLVSCLNTSIQL